MIGSRSCPDIAEYDTYLPIQCLFTVVPLLDHIQDLDSGQSDVKLYGDNLAIGSDWSTSSDHFRPVGFF